MKADTTKKRIILTVFVAALGYFVDIYDLLLFSIVRVSSLKDLGVSEEELLSTGVLLINSQMLGLLFGGILWGILGDVRGRLSVLFGSIFLYSIANFSNGLVTSVGAYSVLRFIAGVGLAGELGAGITLVAEILPKEKRGLGTTIVASIGILGAVCGSLVADLVPWRYAYFIGGALGMALLFLRVGVSESEMFAKVKNRVGSGARRGDFLSLWTGRENLFKYLRCIFIGVPIWYVIGILITFSPELSRAMGLQVTASAGSAVMWSYLGLSIGDLASGLLSQVLKSRRKSVLVFLTLSVALSFYYLYAAPRSMVGFYFLCAFLGFSTGFWAVFVTVAAEQFGTHLRATVATTVPNFVRGSVVPLTMAFQYLSTSVSLIHSAMLVGALSFVLAYISLWKMEETFHKDLDF